jgi:hypothetical protein
MLQRNPVLDSYVIPSISGHLSSVFAEQTTLVEANIAFWRRMMNELVETISHKNLSVAWSLAFLKLMEHGCGEITPLVVSITGFENGEAQEDESIRELLDAELKKRKKATCDTIANTIFPLSMWNPKAPNSALYERYKKAWPRIRHCGANHRGVYFHRFIAFEKAERPINQLQHVIDTWRIGNHRHSALQASVFDPRRDHTNSRQLGFPCLHQVSFTPLGTNGQDGLTVTGFYGTQHIFEKAYGNYLGLCRLGRFMAKGMGLTLTKVNCIASLAKLGDGYSKNEFSILQEKIRVIREKKEVL